MKACPTRLTDAIGNPITKSENLTVGREYVVLSLHVFLREPRQRVWAHVITDRGGRHSGLFDLADFEITDDRPSRSWRVRFEGSRLEIQPDAWMVADFWETFHNENPGTPVPDVTERFDRAVHALFEEAGASWKDEPAPWSTHDIRER